MTIMDNFIHMIYAYESKNEGATALVSVIYGCT